MTESLTTATERIMWLDCFVSQGKVVKYQHDFVTDICLILFLSRIAICDL